jgi:hypothetical protein
MSEPIILDGGAQMITIKLPAYFQKHAKEGGMFSVSPKSKNEPFQRIVITNLETGSEVLSWPIEDNRKWKIEIK